ETVFHGKQRSGIVQSQMTIKQWQPPPEYVLKINFDGTFTKENRKGAWGFIIRDHSGFGIAAAALQSAFNLGIRNIVLESDCLNLVKALNSTDSDLAFEGVLFKELRKFIASDFISAN
ncbi:hypothetical protein ACJX0J_014632, partial [Zea mays]